MLPLIEALRMHSRVAQGNLAVRSLLSLVLTVLLLGSITAHAQSEITEIREGMDGIAKTVEKLAKTSDAIGIYSFTKTYPIGFEAEEYGWVDLLDGEIDAAGNPAGGNR